MIGNRMPCTLQLELGFAQTGDPGKTETECDVRLDLGMREERDSQLEALFAITDRWKAKHGTSVGMLT